MRLPSNQSRVMQPHPPMGAKPKTRLRLDPQRALEPARKKLSTLEAQRIMAVLVDSIKRIELVTALPEYIIENLDRFKVMLGADLVQLLEDHKVVIQSFDELKSEAERLLQRDKTPSPELREDDEEEEEEDVEEEEQEEEEEDEDGEQNPSQSPFRLDTESEAEGSRPDSACSISSQADAALRNLGLVAKQMQESCKNILRGFSLNPSTLTSILKDFEDRTDPAQDMIYELSELKDILMGMLLTTPVEETERNQYLREVSERERYNAGVIAKLEAELAAANDDKDTEVN